MNGSSTQTTDTAVLETSDESVLELEALQRLAELDPSDAQAVVQKVLCAYERALKKALGELEVAMQERDLAAIQRITHTLRSSSASVGAQRFSEVCSEVEKSIRSRSTMQLEPRLQELKCEGQRVIVAVGQLLVARGYGT